MNSPEVMLVPLARTIPEFVSSSRMCHSPRSQLWLPELYISIQSPLE